jgi:hypothetical protein
MMVWWDPAGKNPEFASNPDGGGSGSGCWRPVDAGRRSLLGQWPAVDLGLRKKASTDQCNGNY